MRPYARCQAAFDCTHTSRQLGPHVTLMLTFPGSPLCWPIALARSRSISLDLERVFLQLVYLASYLLAYLLLLAYLPTHLLTWQAVYAYVHVGVCIYLLRLLTWQAASRLHSLDLESLGSRNTARRRLVDAERRASKYAEAKAKAIRVHMHAYAHTTPSLRARSKLGAHAATCTCTHAHMHTFARLACTIHACMQGGFDTGFDTGFNTGEDARMGHMYAHARALCVAHRYTARHCKCRASFVVCSRGVSSMTSRPPWPSAG